MLFLGLEQVIIRRGSRSNRYAMIPPISSTRGSRDYHHRFSFIFSHRTIDANQIDHDHGCTITIKQPQRTTLLKLRDIAQARENKKGSIEALAKRFHASTSTVSKAIQRPVAEWQAEIDRATRGELRKWEYIAATLEPIHSDPADRIVAYAVQLEGQATMIRVDGPSIVPAANQLGSLLRNPFLNRTSYHRCGFRF
ncbi:MAG TPA: hypothetical protein VKM55_29815 [Candidatus Lokiarchaeia archaeon]|nr:hypothetical protein [Candidatus Lokiarchaeia archaeon]